MVPAGFVNRCTWEGRLRVPDLEKEVQELKQVDHSTALLATIKFDVLTAVKEYLGKSLGDALHKLALMELILTDEDAMDQGVADKSKKRKLGNDDDRDKDPPARPYQGFKRRKTSKDDEPSKRSNPTGSFKGNTSSVPKPKSIGKSVHTEETVYKTEATKMPQNQGDVLGTSNEQTNVEAALKYDWRKHSQKYTTSIPKIKAVKYELNGIKDMVPMLWSPIKKKVEDLQLGVESYQKKLNISKPRTHDEDHSRRASYTTLSDPQGVIYEDKLNIKRLMHSNELHKFSDVAGKKVDEEFRSLLVEEYT
nr:hypothetical protein [Tanacetum cinerariifolium]